MKKLIKFNAALVGFGLIILNISYLKRRRNDRNENKILKKIKSKYQGFQIKGAWIQRHNRQYLGGITILINGEPHQHHFTTDKNGQPMIMD